MKIVVCAAPSDWKPIEQHLSCFMLTDYGSLSAEGFYSGIKTARSTSKENEGDPILREMSFTPGSGFGRFRPSEIEEELGLLWR